MNFRPAGDPSRSSFIFFSKLIPSLIFVEYSFPKREMLNLGIESQAQRKDQKRVGQFALTTEMQGAFERAICAYETLDLAISVSVVGVMGSETSGGVLHKGDVDAALVASGFSVVAEPRTGKLEGLSATCTALLF